MQYKVTIRRSMMFRLKKVATIIEQQELLARDFVTCLIDTEVSKDHFWKTW